MLAWLALTAAVAPAAARAEISLRDDSGAQVRLQHPARRIISLAPNITEMLFAAGAGDRIVGTVQFSDYPPAAARIARIGSYTNLDLEAIVALKPDLVIGWQSGNPSAQRQPLMRLGIAWFWSEPHRLEDIARTLEQFGLLAGTSPSADAAAEAFRTRLADLRRQYSKRPPVRVFYQIWADPPITIGGPQIISHVIELCGGINIFGAMTMLAPEVSVEAVLAANPEAIVASGAEQTRPHWLDDWRRWQGLTAAMRGNLFFIPPDLIQRHTPRLLDGAEQLCQDLDEARQRRPAPPARADAATLQR